MIEEFEKNLKIMLELTKAKNHDYAKGDDPYKNFRLVEQLEICSVETGILVRMCDKMSRISNLLETEGKVADEKIEDTLLDLANYSIILKCYLEQKKGVE